MQPAHNMRPSDLPSDITNYKSQLFKRKAKKGSFYKLAARADPSRPQGGGWLIQSRFGALENHNWGFCGK